MAARGPELIVLPHADPATLAAAFDLRRPGPDLRALMGLAPRLDALFRVAPPTAPGATVVGAVFRAAGETLSATGCSARPARALAACLGEVAETLAQVAAPGDPVARAPLTAPPAEAGLSPAELREAAARLGGGADAAEPWIAARRLPDGAACLLPARLCLRGLGARPEVPLSEGCAAGPRPAAALSAALHELAEREARARFGDAEAGCALPPGAARAARAALAALRGGAAGPPVALVAIGLPGRPPVVLARSALGEGCAARGDLAAAARAALRELVAAETGALIAAARGAPVAPPPPLRAVAGRPAPPPGDIDAMVAALAAAGAPVRAVELRRAGPGAAIVKAVVLAPPP